MALPEWHATVGSPTPAGKDTTANQTPGAGSDARARRGPRTASSPAHLTRTATTQSSFCSLRERVTAPARRPDGTAGSSRPEPPPHDV